MSIGCLIPYSKSCRIAWISSFQLDVDLAAVRVSPRTKSQYTLHKPKWNSVSFLFDRAVNSILHPIRENGVPIRRNVLHAQSNQIFP